MQTNEEISQDELLRYALALREVVEGVCESPAFRTSPKSCEFLRHVTHQTLDGQVDVLKERLIGMTLLGRDASYDTGADAGVRVRANDVRKRLSAYYKSNASPMGFSIELPPGSYVPRFFRRVTSIHKLPFPIEQPSNVWSQQEHAAPLSLQWLAIPTVMALFLCTMCMRWQLSQEHPFTTFWQDVFQNHRAVLYLPPSNSRGGQDSITMQELDAAAPLFNLAGQFHREFTVVNALSSSGSTGDEVILLGAGLQNSGNSAGVSSHLDPIFQPDQQRLVIEDKPGGREIVDRNTSNSRLQISGRAALLTIVNGAQRSIRIDGTDDEAVNSAVHALCERATFPEGLANSLQQDTVTQVVFPLAPHADAMILHEPMQIGQIKMDRPIR